LYLNFISAMRIHDETRNGNSISADFTEDTISFPAIFRQFGSCFVLFDIAGQTQYMYIVGKYKFHLHSLRNRTEKLTKGS
jgi:hypothetical protein